MTDTEPIRHAFHDPLSNTQRTLVVTDRPETTGVEHPDCAELAQVASTFDAAFCATCRWQCRISGAWFVDVVTAARVALATGGRVAGERAPWVDENGVHDGPIPESTPGQPFRSREVHAFFVIDDDGDEGLPSFWMESPAGPVMMPLVATDRARLEALEARAQELADFLGKRLEHVVFRRRDHYEWIEPK